MFLWKVFIQLFDRDRHLIIIFVFFLEFNYLILFFFEEPTRIYVV
jgi:hypothetical protein